MNREKMTIDEAMAIIRKEYLCVDRDCDIEQNCGKCDLMMPSKEPILEAYKMAIKALEQEPCEDAIDKAEAIKIASGYCHPANVAKELAKLPAVNPQPKTGRWVPVGERLPKENEEVLVTTVWGEVTIGERYSTIDYFINDGAINANEDEIIAWMPLPKPYEPQERSGKG